MNPEISVLLVDDHPVFRKGLRMMLEEDEGISVAGEAGDGEEAIGKATELTPDVVVMDISMPGMDGIEATRRIVAELPGVKVLPLSIHSGKRFVENMLRAGAAGYVLKESAPEELVAAIRAVHGGDVFLSREVSGVVISEYRRLLNQPDAPGGADALTDDEQAVLRLIGEGHPVKEIAIALDQSATAVQAARRRLVRKLDLGGVTELAEYAAADRWSAGESRVEQMAPGERDAAVGMPILATKLYPPVLSPDHVSRQRLLDRMTERRDLPVTLVSAPAGYGKSSLLAEWMAATQRPTVWLSLDRDDSDPSVFLAYLVTALEAVFPDGCAQTRALLRVPQLPPPRAIASYLLNDLSAIGASFDLVLDDYHRIVGSEIHDLMGEVFRYPPPNVHWFLLARRDPPLPLASMRAAGKLLEIRFEDLRMTSDEGASSIRKILGSSVDDTTIQRLCEAAEGWVTALRLAALALVNHRDPDSLIEKMHSAPGGIRDYLTEQVLAAQEPEIQGRLLETAILDRFCAPLCEAVCGTDGGDAPDGEAFIDRLVKSGLFVIAMDSAGEWYRFHHLLQHLLEAKLTARADATEVAALHGRASRWFESQGLIDEALAHALKAGDAGRAADLVEDQIPAALNAERWQQIGRWLGSIPGELWQERPKLLLGAAYVAVERSRLEELPALVGRLEALVGGDEVEEEVLGPLNHYRGQVHYWSGEPGRAYELLLEARGQIPASQYVIAGENELLVGLALQALGRHAEAREELVRRQRSAGSAAPTYQSRLVAGQVFVDTLAGELAGAEEGARLMESIARQNGNAYVERWSAYNQTQAHFHWFDFAEALRICLGLAETIHLLHPRVAADTLAVLAICHQAVDQLEESEAAIRALREYAEESGNPEIRTVAGSCEARLAVWRGDLDPAVRWQRSLREPVHFPSCIFWLEVPAVTECRVLVARGRASDLEEAGQKLAALHEGLGNLHNTSQLIEVTVLQALALEKMNRPEEAVSTLGEAVALAERGGWIRPFVEPGEPVDEMLSRLEPSEDLAAFVEQLRGSIAGRKAAPAGAPASASTSLQPLIEPLTNRELDVLDLIAKRLYDKEIADRLSISPGTVKSHLKHIYQKLSVGNRRAAVDRALALGIV